jgi:hypothetical protein
MSQFLLVADLKVTIRVVVEIVLASQQVTRTAHMPP